VQINADELVPDLSSDLPENKREKKLHHYKEVKQQLKQEQFFSNNCVLYDLYVYLYFNMFKIFNFAWVDMRPNIMQFTQFIQNIYENQFIPLSGQMIKEFVLGIEQELANFKRKSPEIYYRLLDEDLFRDEEVKRGGQQK